MQSCKIKFCSAHWTIIITITITIIIIMTMIVIISSIINMILAQKMINWVYAINSDPLFSSAGSSWWCICLSSQCLLYNPFVIFISIIIITIIITINSLSLPLPIVITFVRTKMIIMMILSIHVSAINELKDPLWNNRTVVGIDCCPKSPMDQDSGRIAFVRLENLLDLLLVCWERQEGGFSRTRDRRHEMGRHIVAQLQKDKKTKI